jgi:hypothetical protein
MMNEHASPNAPPRSRRLHRIAISLGCIALGVVGGLLTFVLTTIRRPPPAMTAADFEAAVARWAANRPVNYEMEIQLRGRQSGTIRVMIKDNEPIHVEHNDVSVAQSAWEYWTVDGLFKIIRTDLEGLDQPERAFGEQDVAQLVQQAEFDTKLGYPRRYRRAVLTTGDEIEWEIVQFNVE